MMFLGSWYRSENTLLQIAVVLSSNFLLPNLNSHLVGLFLFCFSSLVLLEVLMYS